MMKQLISISALAMAALAATAPLAAHAADGTITFTGTISAQTCTINAGVPNFTVTMPRVSTSSLSVAGATAGEVRNSIRINLTSCSPAIPGSVWGAVRAFFESGATVDTTTRRLTNSGTATNVQVGIINPDGTNVSIGSDSGSQGTTYVTIVSPGTANLVYGSKYVATGGGAGTGTVNTSVSYSLEYQ